MDGESQLFSEVWLWGAGSDEEMQSLTEKCYLLAFPNIQGNHSPLLYPSLAVASGTFKLKMEMSVLSRWGPALPSCAEGVTL